MKTWTKTVVGLLNTRDAAQFAINDLINCGVAQDAITLRFADVEHHIWSEEEETDVEKGTRGAAELNARQGTAGLGSGGNAYGTKVSVGRGDLAALTELGISAPAAHYYADGVERGGYLLTVVVKNDKVEETAEILRRHGAVEDERPYSLRGLEGTANVESLDQPAGQRPAPEHVPLSHATLKEQLERAEVFQDRAEVTSDLAARNPQQFVGKEVSLPSSDIFRQRDIRQFDVLQRDIQEGKVPGQEFRPPESEAGGPRVATGHQAGSVSGMDDEEFQRHFRDTYGERGERFEEPYRSAYHFAEAESSSHPQFMDKEWYEVEEELHKDWEMYHPGTWNRVENAIHFGWDKTRRHH